MSADELRRHGDRAEISDLIQRYAQCIDAGDFDTVIGLFAPDGRMADAAGVVEGIENIRAALSPEGLRRSRAANSGLQFEKSTHLMGGSLITIDGDLARAQSTAVAYLLGPQGGREVLIMRGITYGDTFVRLPEGWRIRSRTHAAIWSHGPTPTGS